MKILIKNVLESDAAIFHNEGLLVNGVIELGIKFGKKVSLSFDEIEHCSTQFLNAAIGKLYRDHDIEILKLTFEVIDISLSIQNRLDRVIKNAIRSEAYDKMIHEAVAEL
jgi:hypothetical protein